MADVDGRRVAVVGGGIAGLAAAYRLSVRAPDTTVSVYEREGRFGGKIVTIREDGFVVEGGPDSFLSAKPRGTGLVRELGLAGELEGTIPEMRGSFIQWHGRLYPIPEGLSGLVPARLGPLLRTGLLSPGGKLRAALEPVIPRRRETGDESLESFMRRRFGREAYERLIEALLSGIYGGSGAGLSLLATFPQLAAMEREHGGLIRGVARTSRAGTPSSSVSPFVAPISGMGALVQGLTAALSNAELRLHTEIQAVERRGRGYVLSLASGESALADAVIVSTPAHAAARLIENLDADLAAALAAIPYTSTATVSLAFPRAAVLHPLDGYGYIVPRREGRPVLACTWVTSKFAHRAPPGDALLRVFIGGVRAGELVGAPDDQLLQIARDELRRTLNITNVPSRYWIFRWKNAMPQYTVGHLDQLRTIDERLARHPGLHVAGASYRGVGIPDCIASGEAAADAILHDLAVSAT